MFRQTRHYIFSVTKYANFFLHRPQVDLLIIINFTFSLFLATLISHIKRLRLDILVKFKIISNKSSDM